MPEQEDALENQEAGEQEAGEEPESLEFLRKGLKEFFREIVVNVPESEVQAIKQELADVGGITFMPLEGEEREAVLPSPKVEYDLSRDLGEILDQIIDDLITDVQSEVRDEAMLIEDLAAIVAVLREDPQLVVVKLAELGFLE